MTGDDVALDRQSKRIGRDMPFASLHLLAGVEAPGASGLGGLHRLAFGDHHIGLGILPFRLAHRHGQGGENLVPQAAVARSLEAVLHRGERREVLRQIPAGVARADKV